MKTKSKTTAKSKATKKVILPVPSKGNVTWKYVLSLPFRILSLPFYAIYMILFEVPAIPSFLLGFFRFAVFVFIGLNIETLSFNHFIQDVIQGFGAPKMCATLILGIKSIILLINLFLSFMEIFGFHDPSTSGFSYKSDVESNDSNLNRSSFNEALEYRDTLLKAKHTLGKIEELKKTGFITKERLFGVGQSKEVNEALELVNSQMGAMHTPDKYKFLKGMFGG